MKARIVFIIIPLLLLAGCGIPFNRPAVGPNGTIAFFLDESGAYHFMPRRGTLVLLNNGQLNTVTGVKTTGDCGAVSWSRDGNELVFVDTKPGDWGIPAEWMINIAAAQTNSQVTVVTRSGTPLISPAFTPTGNVTYMAVDDDGNGHLYLYDRIEEVTYPLLSDALSYRPAKSGPELWVIKRSDEGSLSMGHLVRYNPETGDEDEVAEFFLGGDMEEAFLLFPAPFLWDVDPSGRYIALTLFDQALVTPELDNQDTSLYLIDVDENAATRISTRGIAPAFSPDGEHLAYIGSEDGKTQSAIIYTRSTQERIKVPATDEVAGVFWIDAGHLGLIMREQTESSLGAEPGDMSDEEADSYYLLSFDLGTGTISPLIPN